jgi:hypothetical protein
VVTLLGLRGGFAGFVGAVIDSGKLRELPPFSRKFTVTEAGSPQARCRRRAGFYLSFD